MDNTAVTAKTGRPRGLVSMRVEMYERPSQAEKKLISATNGPQNKTASREVARTRIAAVVEASAPSPAPPQPPEAENREEEDVQTRGGGGGASEDDDNYVGSALIEIGVQHYKCGEYEKAIKAFNTALKTQRVSVGDEHACIAITLSNLGAVYLQQSRLDDAEEALASSLAMKRSVAPNLSVADTLNNLGNCANIRGDNKASVKYYREALSDLRQKKGKPVDIANALFNIGRLEIQQRQWDAAMSVLTESWRITREVYGESHVFVAQTLELIGFIQLSTTEYDASMVSFTGALAIYRSLFGPLHVDVANSLFNIGMVREAKGDLHDAWEAYTTSRDLYARLNTNHDHPGFRTVRRSIAYVERAISHQNQARLLAKHQEARESARKAKRSVRTTAL